MGMCGILRVMAGPAKLRSFLACFTVALVVCCASVGAHDLDKRDVGTSLPLNGQTYRGWTSRTASKDAVVLGKIILGSVQKSRKAGNHVQGKDLNVDPVNSSIEGTSGYQSDAEWNNLEHLQGEVYGPPSSRNPAVKRLLDMEPSVQCRDNFMTLQVKGGLLGSGLTVERGDGLLLPLSKLPPHCGYSLRTTWRDMVFTAPYDGCYGIKEGDSYVLPLRWLGTPMKMACPHYHSTTPASVACYPSGMVVKIDAPQVVASKLNIKFKNEWKPLLWVSAQCGYSVVTHPGGLVITAPFTPCAETKDGMHTVEILEGKIKLSCPSTSNDSITDNQPGTPVPDYPQPPKPTTVSPWSPGFLYPQPLKPIVATTTPKPIPPYPQPSKPTLATAAPWSPGFGFPQPPKHVPATAAPWSPGFGFPQPPEHVPATAAPWSPGFAFPQPPEHVPATAAPRPATAYLKPETGTDVLPPYPPFDKPISPWGVYLQPAASISGKEEMLRTYVSKPAAGYRCSHSNCWPLSYHQHNHLHLGSDNFGCANLPSLAGERHPASYTALLPYSRQYNLKYASPSSRPAKPLLGGSAMRLRTPALPPLVSHQAFQNYWDLVVPFSSYKGPYPLHSTSLSQTNIPLPHLWPDANNYWSAARPLYPAPQTPREPAFSHRLVQHFSKGRNP